MGMLASLIAGFASGETVAAIRRARTAAAVYAVAAAAALCGVGFLIGAGYIKAAEAYGPFAASLGFGIGFLVLAGLILVIHRLSAGSRSRPRLERRGAELKTVGITTALALLPTLLRRKSALGMILAPVAALFAYEIYRENTKPKTRRPE